MDAFTLIHSPVVDLGLALPAALQMGPCSAQLKLAQPIPMEKLESDLQFSRTNLCNLSFFKALRNSFKVLSNAPESFDGNRRCFAIRIGADSVGFGAQLNSIFVS
jgi:hypothetical protein